MLLSKFRVNIFAETTPANNVSSVPAHGSIHVVSAETLPLVGYTVVAQFSTRGLHFPVFLQNQLTTF